MKESFILYNSFYPPIKSLSWEQKGKLLDAIFQFHIDGTIPSFVDEDPALKISFLFVKQAFDHNKAKYEAVVERNKENGKKGGRPPKNNDSQHQEPKKPSGLSGLIEKPKKADNDNEYDNEYVNSNNNSEIKISPKSKTIGQDNTQKDHQPINGQSVHKGSIPAAQGTQKQISYLKAWADYISKNPIPPGFEEHILIWLKYKSEKGQTYKPTGLSSLVDRILTLSNQNPERARAMITYSMSQNYNGIFLERKPQTTEKPGQVLHTQQGQAILDKIQKQKQK
ncbi:MAG: DUF6291 domain-containing protein [Bacteroidota bacterium]